MFNKFLKNKEVMDILERLNNNGNTGFIVGGAVRDMLCGIKPHDIDFTTNVDYDMLKERFPEYHCNETGKAFGVLRIKKDKSEFEIAKYRQDITSDEVSFVTDIKDDLSRRDFTINAMAWNKETGLVDMFGGKQDIWDKKIRFVGNADERIKEDPARMLRAVRFVAKMGFEIEENSFNAIKENAHLINNVAKERIHDEFVRTMKSSDYLKAIETMKETGLLSQIIPETKKMYDFEQNNPYHSLDLWEHTLNVLENCKDSDYITRIAALFHDIGKPKTKSIDEVTGYYHFYNHEKVGAEITRDRLNSLRFTGQEVKDITTMVEKHMDFHRSESDKAIRRMVHNIGRENTLRLAELSFADDEGKRHENRHNDLYDKVIKVIEDFDIPKVSDLKLDGRMLMDMGFVGKEIGEVKKYLLNLVLEEGIPNDRDILQKKVEEKYFKKTKTNSYNR